MTTAEPVPADESTRARPRRPLTGRAFQGAPVVAALTLLSRLLGLARDMATAAVFGAGPVLDAFTVAFRLPNLARRLLGEGALSAAVLPALVKTREDRGEVESDALAAAVIGRLTVGVGLATLLAEVVLIPLALGWVGDLDEEWRLLWGLTAACGPLATFTCVGAQYAAALHARRRFAAAALCPVLLNLFWIAGTVGAALWIAAGAGTERAIYSVAAAVSVGGAAQVVLMAVALRRAGFVWRWDPVGTRPALRAIRAAVAPALFGLSIAQMNSLIDGFAAWGFAAPADDPTAEFLPGLLPGVGYPLRPGAASELYFGQRLYQFPVGLLGVTVGTVLFPRFAAASRGELRGVTLAGLRSALYLGVPASVGLVLTADLLADALLRHGEFDRQAAAETAAAAAWLGAGAWAGCGLSIASRVFYASDDHRTPVWVGVWAVGANLVLNVALVWPLGVSGLAAACTAATCGQFLALLWLLRRAIPEWRMAALWPATWRSAAGAAVVAAACLAARALSGPAGLGWPAEGELLAAVVAGSLAFLPAARLLGMREAWELVGLGRRRV
ncbi:murein biosynthesis integral membrane protein MurJ [Alienimonas californiensis]|uniref:Lipid II flippase n=1 Tax=Alienimonas californiensis TaxID=2527989 RepID=A0A517P5U8_9PLAN|nr:murein biosynthesis integral membrane protein MurJ [Alienimonas californiensis]QDT14747.1 Lipid II flippase MurJ [Alienimonas californiensis]